LPSARQKVLGKEAVADVQFAERSLPSVTLDKAFAECKIAFAVCLEHTTKKLIPVVMGKANSRLFFCSLVWLDTPSTHSKIYLHTSNLTKSMCCGFSNVYPYKQNNIEIILYPLYVVSFII
jgi:hypothetical protein